MKISLACAPGPRTRELARRAEALGFDRLWLFDSAALYEDVWIHLAQVAEATTRIGLGTGVLVPNLRHVMTTASAIATIERLAPGRLACAFGTGFTARAVLGQKPLSWRFTRGYLEQLRGLLRGDVVEIEGRPCQMIHRPELARPRPLDVPLLLSAFGPKGLAITREIADGWMGFAPPPERFGWAAQLVTGTVLDPGESAQSARVVEAFGPWQVGMYHATWEWNRDAVAALPGGQVWLDAIAAERPERERHLAVHAGHVTHLTRADRLALGTFAGSIPWNGWVGDAADVMTRARAAQAAGTTELVYVPSGDDLVREATAFMGAVGALGR